MEVVNEFTYLGNRLTNKNEELAAVQVKIQAANRAYFYLVYLLKCHDMNWRFRVTLYKTSLVVLWFMVVNHELSLNKP